MSINPAFCPSSVPAGRRHCHVSHPKWNVFWEQEGSLVAAAAAGTQRGGMRGEAWEKGAAQQVRDGGTSWKNRVSAQSPGGNRQRDPVHPGGERTAWVTAMRKIHQSCSTENKPLGNPPFLLEVEKGVWGCVFTSPFIIIGDFFA